MKQTTESRPRGASPRRLGVAEAKARLSEALREVSEGPTIIHSRGRDLAVLLDIREYERLHLQSGAGKAAGAQFVERLQALRQKLDGGVEGFEPERLRFVPREPFGRRGGRRP